MKEVRSTHRLGPNVKIARKGKMTLRLKRVVISSHRKNPHVIESKKVVCAKRTDDTHRLRR
jgi:hypothetical protein